MSHWCHTPSIPFERMLFFLFKLWYNVAKNNQKIHMWKRFLKEHNGFPIPKLALACLLNLPGKNNATGTTKMLKIVKIPKKGFS